MMARNESFSKNILLIGLGKHATRIYLPALQILQESLPIRLVGIVDRESNRQEIQDQLRDRGLHDLQTLFVPEGNAGGRELDVSLARALDDMASSLQINGVIISTEPLSHLSYARWAIGSGLGVLLDKPITTRENVSTSVDEAIGLRRDYEALAETYRDAQRVNPDIIFSVMAQRRYHPAFLLVAELLTEVFKATDCPITSIQSFHSDGQWRMPTEIIQQDYHPYNSGYGKCSHSGYHSIDLVPWFLALTESPNKRLDQVEVISSFLRPADFFSQIPLRSYQQLFPDFDCVNKYGAQELEAIVDGYGELDAFCNLTFKCAGKVLSLGSLSLVHNGVSQRSWPTTCGRDLYKGNGRIRHETHYIAQGPFQSIQLVSWQAQEIDPARTPREVYAPGGEYHLDVHVFRNSALFQDWKAHEVYNVQRLAGTTLSGDSRGHQEDARFECVREFAEILMGTRPADSCRSDLLDHDRSVKLLSAIYASAALRHAGRNPCVSVEF